MDTTKIKTFFVNHFEKMVLAGVVGLSGYLIYQGLGLEHFTDQYDPVQTTERARQVNREIDEDRTAAIVDGRVPTRDVVAITKEIATAINPSGFKPPKAWTDPQSERIVRRKDPQIMAPRELVMSTVVASIAWQNIKSDLKDDYPLAKQPGADAIGEDSNARPTRRPSPRRGADDRDDGDGFEFGRKPSDRDNEEPVVSRGAGRTFDADYDFGATARTTNGNPPVPKLARFIAGTLVVPHREIYEAYEEALAGADSYLPRRDTPIYVDFEVQRAEVTQKPVDQLVAADWVRIWTLRRYEQVAAKRWAGTAKDIVPPEYRDEQLSNWIPPILLDDYRTFVTHPLIPMTSPDELETGDELEEADASDNTLFSAEEDRRAAPIRGRDAFGAGGDAAFGNARGRRNNANAFGGRRGGADGSTDDEEVPVDYKIIRFYDFHNVNFDPKLVPKPGAKYVYRVRFSVEDPNFPMNPSDEPKLNSMEADVEQRVLQLIAKYKQTKERQYRRWSPWSEPSNPVSLPSLNQQFAGAVDPGSYYDWTVAGKPVRYNRSQPTGKVVTAEFNETFGTRIPFLIDVTEGSILSRQGTADVVDPITMDIKKIEDTRVDNSTTVIDLTGGSPLAMIDGMNQPGMMLLTDEDGRLIVADEVSDLESYRIHSFADEREEEE